MVTERHFPTKDIVFLVALLVLAIVFWFFNDNFLFSKGFGHTQMPDSQGVLLSGNTHKYPDEEIHIQLRG